MEDFTQFNTKSLEKQSQEKACEKAFQKTFQKTFQKAYEKVHETKKYINDMKEMAIRGYHNQLLSLHRPHHRGLFATIIFYCKRSDIIHSFISPLKTTSASSLPYFLFHIN